MFPDKVKSGKKIYWKSKDGDFELFGFFNIQEKISPNADFYFYTANFFGAEFKFPWEQMAQELFYIPLIAYCKVNNSVYFYKSKSIDNVDGLMHLSEPRKYVPAVRVMDISDFTGEMHWAEMIAAALEVFQNGSTSKIVLSRMSIADFEAKVCIFDVVELLRSNSENSYLAFAELPNGDYFITASPETLFRREKNKLYIDALAGTRPVYGEEELDKKMEDDLLSDEKELNEHRIVKEYIIDNIKNLSVSVKSDTQPSIRRYATLQHLHTPIKAELTDIDDHKLLKVLHPTPAVGGMPTGKAMSFIREYEDYHRGLYAAPFGIVSKDYSEFAVAIRSALIRDDKAYIFAGAGIVPGSKAVNEWLETNNKLDNFINAMGYVQR
jgi:menaquinone-specific isochorismate synthase